MQTLKELIESIKKSGILKTRHIINAFERVDRRDFVRPTEYEYAYEDIALPIDYSQTISQPTTVAYMLELLRPQEGNRILDVGSGSGWTTTLLATIVGNRGYVIGVERISELVKFGQNNLAKYKLKNARIIQAGKRLGYEDEAPYDKILVSAASSSVPQELINQLKVNGTMVIPVDNSLHKVTKKTDETIEDKEIYGFVFVPLIRN